MSEQLNELALFSGIGGLSLGLHLADERIKTVCHVELDRYAAAVLMSRMRSGELPYAPIWDDVRTFDGAKWRGCVDIISGGFPCQDISIAGESTRKQLGLKGERSGLWREFSRIIYEVRPRFAFVENVPRVCILGLDKILSDFAQMGYNAEWCSISASDVGAWHKRERTFIFANAINNRHERRNQINRAKRNDEKSIADHNDFRREWRDKNAGFQRIKPHSLWINVNSIKTLWERPDIPQPVI